MSLMKRSAVAILEMTLMSKSKKPIKRYAVIAALLLAVTAYAGGLPEVPDGAVLTKDDENVCPDGTRAYKHWFNRPSTYPQFAEWLTFGVIYADGEHGPVVLIVRFADDADGGVLDAFTSTPAGVEKFASLDELNAKYPRACDVIALQSVKGA